MENLDCEICFNPYDVEKHVPRTLNCGHSLCTKCISDGITAKTMSCPFCRASYNISSAGDISVNFTLLKIVKSLDADTNISLKSSLKTPPSSVYALEPTVHAGICQNHGAYLLFWCVKCEVWLCRDCTVIEHPTLKCSVVSIKQALSTRKEEEDTLITETEVAQNLHVDKLNNYLLSLTKHDEETDQQIDELQRLIEKHQDIKKQLKDKTASAEKCLESGKDMQGNLSEAKNILDESESVEGIERACQESQKCRRNVEDWCKSSTEDFIRSDIIKTFNEFEDRVKLGIQVAESFDEATLSAISSFVRFVTKVKENEHEVTKEELLSLLKFSTIWAVKEEDTGEAALVTNEENGIHLHPIQKNVRLPANVIILKYEFVQSLMRDPENVTYAEEEHSKDLNEICRVKAVPSQHCRLEVSQPILEMEPKEVMHFYTPRGDATVELPGTPRSDVLRGDNILELPRPPRSDVLRGDNIIELPRTPRSDVLRGDYIIGLPRPPRFDVLRGATIIKSDGTVILPRPVSPQVLSQSKPRTIHKMGFL